MIDETATKQSSVLDNLEFSKTIKIRTYNHLGNRFRLTSSFLFLVFVAPDQVELVLEWEISKLWQGTWARPLFSVPILFHMPRLHFLHRCLRILASNHHKGTNLFSSFNCHMRSKTYCTTGHVYKPWCHSATKLGLNIQLQIHFWCAIPLKISNKKMPTHTML